MAPDSFDASEMQFCPSKESDVAETCMFNEGKVCEMGLLENGKQVRAADDAADNEAGNGGKLEERASLANRVPKWY